jgi:SpoVK/Ycf46/Vps4 family AAA+-type ATPase
MTIAERLLRAKGAATPLILVTTHDPINLVRSIWTEWDTVEAFNGGLRCEWDAAIGLRASTTKQEPEVTNIKGAVKNLKDLILRFVDKDLVPDYSTIIMHNLHAFYTEAAVVQALIDVREAAKEHNITFIITAPHSTLPVELRDHFSVFREPLPTRIKIREMVDRIIETGCKTYEINPKTIDEATRKNVTTALVGFPLFIAEGIVSMSFNENGLDMKELWSRQKDMISQIRGLKVLHTETRLDDIGGHANAKNRFESLANTGRVKVIARLDEFEKMFSGDDSSGVMQRIRGKWLTWMADVKAVGCLFGGVTGSGKSVLTEAIANHLKLPLINISIGDVMQKHVGESEENTDLMFGMLEALGAGDDGEIEEGSIVIVATCNETANLTPEAQARLQYLRIFFSEPDKAERNAIWDIHQRYYEVSGERPPDDKWTGREIKICCAKAALEKIPLLEAAETIIPALISHHDEITDMKNRAKGKFLSSSYNGVFGHPPKEGGGGTRKITKTK